MIDCNMLFVDDDELIRRVVEREMENKISYTHTVSGPNEALAALELLKYDIVVTDLRMNGSGPLNDDIGINLVRTIKEMYPEMEIIVQTGYGSTDNMEKAMCAGAYDCLEKPYKIERLALMVERATESRRMRRELSALRQQVAFEYGFDGLIGSSPAMLRLKESMATIAETDSPVLIIGESGVGKSLVAKTIHHHSRRRKETLLTFDCASVAERLIDSELFGVTGRGNRSGRVTGWYQQTDKGSLIIKQVERLPLTSQGKLHSELFRATSLPEHDALERLADVRIFATNNIGWETAVSERGFLGSLAERLSANTLLVPALRDRIDDVPALAQKFLQNYASASKDITVAQFTGSALEKLMEHTWSGNVRELQNTVRRALALSSDGTVSPDDVFFTSDGGSGEGRANTSTLTVNGSLEMTYRARILKSLEDNHWNYSQTANELGIGRTTLWRKVKKYKLQRELLADQT
ncbi:sigma-54-dependent Fis family transcriptional regulator [Gemmatimonas aurantiaca]|nr:sigma-54-dependent Fis family transcriptional regulator [Gemmatimonas aurantiaca]